MPEIQRKQSEQRNYKKLLPLSYEQRGNFLFQREKYDLTDISKVTNIDLNKIKQDYRIGLTLLENLIKLFYLLEEKGNKNTEKYIKKMDLESKWGEDYKYFQRIPLIGIEEYAILHFYNPELLNSLKNKL